MASYEMSDTKQTPYASDKPTTYETSPARASDPVYEDPNRGFFGRFADSFKPAPATASGSNDAGGAYEKPKPAGELHKKLQGRHLQMIAIGGSIGTGLFVGSAGSFVAGGPAAVLIAFMLIGVMLFCVVHALGELAVLFPIQGSFSIYSARFIEPAWGFAMGWNYAMQWLIVLPLELSAAGIVIGFWNTGVNLGVYITIFFLLILAINLCGVRGYGEAEFLFSIVKVLAVVGFIILGIVIDVGGAPNGKYLGVETWRNPGAFSNGFHGLCAVFVNAAFSFAGTELVGLAAAETANPRKTLPKAAKQVFWRIAIFYIISLLLVGFIVPWNDERLINTDQVANRSPFVIAIQIGGIKVLPDIFNAVILIAVLSVGNSSTYGSSRTMAGMARAGLAPKWLGYVDRSGRPLTALGVALAFGLLAYINLAQDGSTIFNWLLAISALSSFFTWGSICFAHIRFRQAWAAQGHSLKEIPFRSVPGVIGSWFGLILNVLCLIAQFYVAIFPPGTGTRGSASDFFQAYLAVPVIILFWLVYKAFNWNTTKWIKLSEMDLDTNRRSLDSAEIEAEEEKERLNPTPAYKKAWKTVC